MRFEMLVFVSVWVWILSSYNSFACSESYAIASIIKINIKYLIFQIISLNLQLIIYESQSFQTSLQTNKNTIVFWHTLLQKIIF